MITIVLITLLSVLACVAARKLGYDEGFKEGKRTAEDVATRRVRRSHIPIFWNSNTNGRN